MVEELRGRGLLAKVLLAFACVYFIWGSTYLAIRIAVEHIPPLLLCAVRLLLAGAMLLAWARGTGAAWPRGAQWRNAALVGVMLPAIGNATVTLGVKHVPSGLVALLVGMIPLWMAMMASVGRHAVRPTPQAIAGLLLGFCGIALLIGPGLLDATHAEFSPLWALVPMAGSLSWAWGSVWSRRVKLPASPLVSTGIGLLAGGALLLAVSFASGEPAGFHAEQVTPGAVAALLYLSVFGSVVGFTAYLYLLRTVSPSMAATYAFVNPIVALALGWVFAHEALSSRTLLAAAVVVVAVALITTSRARSPVAAGAPRTASVALEP